MDQRTQKKREGILEEMRQIDRLRQGTVSEQFYGTGETRQGPYYVQQGYTAGKHWSKRVSRDQVDQVRADINAGVRFKELCQEFAEVTEQATIAEDQLGSKKNARKPSRSGTGKPKRS
jgi:hypothetical protein